MQSSQHYLRSYFEKYRKVQKIRHDIHITQLNISQYLYIFTCVFKRTNACIKAEARPPPPTASLPHSAVGPHPSDASQTFTYMCIYVTTRSSEILTWKSLYCTHPSVNWVSHSTFRVLPVTHTSSAAPARCLQSSPPHISHSIPDRQFSSSIWLL